MLVLSDINIPINTVIAPYNKTAIIVIVFIFCICKGKPERKILKKYFIQTELSCGKRKNMKNSKKLLTGTNIKIK